MKLTKEQEDAVYELVKLIVDMQWDYDRFSSSGKETYDKIVKQLPLIEPIFHTE